MEDSSFTHARLHQASSVPAVLGAGTIVVNVEFSDFTDDYILGEKYPVSEDGEKCAWM